MQAGKQFHIKKAKSKLWPRTSAVKMNAIDHPFGSGRGKNPKPKIAKRNAPPGAKVGLIRPRRTTIPPDLSINWKRHKKNTGL